jgi:membrane protein implicated in regulation of membrane protease activity
MAELGKFLIVAGGLLVCVGALFLLGGKLPWLGRLPGDIVVQRENFSFNFPIATSVLVSIALSLLFALLRR